ncbi:protein mono-ADP-ribosyltransferase PARP12-like [Tympanuchus pallidicinctus]|uniref:protein mono-ADP-ribosyltransferase PARP12-like n=1 Tax=Tympanuchus pallidicinctus TaxID=109042 RepID=UPI002286F3AC|nr:protein mono-ADP-ribosyltransferase PARP12-like [Tympanuchus pallidicinctus]
MRAARAAQLAQCPLGRQRGMTAVPGALRSPPGRHGRSHSAARPFPLDLSSRRRFRFRFLAQEARERRRRSRFRAGPSGSGSPRRKQPRPAMALPTQVLRALCAGGGSLELEELLRRLPGRPTAEQLAAVVRDPRHFTLVRTPDEAGAAAAAATVTVLVVATSSLRLCPEHGAGCRGGCGRLHLCKYHLKGVCRNQQARKECKFVHDFYSPHNHTVLIQHGLDSTFSSDELRQLLLQNDPTLLPEVCLYYNKGDGPYGSCTFKKLCTKLHVCQYFLRGQCRFGSTCKRSHDLSKPECCEKLEKQGMSSDIIQKLPSIYRNMYAIQNSKGSKHDTEENKSSPCKERKHSSSQESTSTSNEVEQICLYHLYTSCVFGDKCIRIHFHLPYRWQISDGNTWKDLENMEELEKEYCDPNNIRSARHISKWGFIFSYISFVDMQSGLKKVRRLSTASSVTKPPHFILTTEWIWYWEDEYGVWQEYGKKDSDHAAATVSSDDLEKAYAAGSSPKLNFKAGVHEYELDFAAMTQKNLRYRTERKVCRRPKFVSQSEVEKIRKRGFKNTEEFKRIPSHWDKSALPELGFKLIDLDSSSEEYNKVKGDFQRTMPKTQIKKICRIQNPSLWELYQWQKEQMEKSNGGKTDERFLFHGTSKKHIDAICHQNFDWRICGLNGTVYGKGSYFARDASYSDAYCKEGSCSKTMFLARVLVGEFTVGRSSYVRPPLKDNQNFYDSCVNSSSNPSIFVIFEKQQVYPEYLIEYLDQACARML